MIFYALRFAKAVVMDGSLGTAHGIFVRYPEVPPLSCTLSTVCEIFVRYPRGATLD